MTVSHPACQVEPVPPMHPSLFLGSVCVSGCSPSPSAMIMMPTCSLPAFLVATFLLLLLCNAPTAAAAASLISSSDARLPMSLSSVVSDLEAEGCNDILATCVVTSRTMTRSERQTLCASLTGIADDSSSSSAVLGLDNGLAVATPDSPSAVAETAMACGGTVVYYPTTTDLSRGEGLFDSLAPAMECLWAHKHSQEPVPTESSSSSPKVLFVVCPEGTDPDTVQTQLEAAAPAVLSRLIGRNGAPKALADVFDTVQYISVSDVAAQLKAAAPTATPEVIRSKIAALATEALLAAAPGSDSAASWLTTATLQPEDVAAARHLGPLARELLDSSLQTVTQALTSDDGDVDSTLVTEFGRLGQVATEQALEQLRKNADGMATSRVGSQIALNLRDALQAQLADIAGSQLQLLEDQCFASYKQALSKLMVGPQLGADMAKVVQDNVKAFAKQAKTIDRNQAEAARIAFGRRLQQHAANRLQNARAGGQFKPVPRKGVTIGMHWLLPKPFGNDFRQEPWMAHATDQMVYIPPDKISDVPEDAVRRGDWRDQVVPSPIGNDLLYTQ